MITINMGETHIDGSSNQLINEIAIGIMNVCESISEKHDDMSEEEVLEYILQALQGQKLGRAGMSMDMMEEVMGVKIDREKSQLLRGEE